MSPRRWPGSFSSWSVATCRMGTGSTSRASSRRAKIPETVDEKLIAKYGIGVSRTSRARRKAVGIANVHYIRYQRRFLLLATHGFHPFYDDEAKNIRDVRRIPIKFEGYSISVAKGGFLRKPKEGGPAVRDSKWRVRVQIEAELYKGLKAYFEDIALYRTARPTGGRACRPALRALCTGASAIAESDTLYQPAAGNRQSGAVGLLGAAISAADCAAVRHRGNVAGDRSQES